MAGIRNLKPKTTPGSFGTDMALSDQLREMGLRPGDWIAVLGDLASGGEPPDDAAIDRLLDEIVGVVGECGHVVVPTFTMGVEFHPETTPAATGRVAERFRRRPGVIRSRHPMLSVAVLGPEARAVLADHDLYLPFRPETPLGQVAERNGGILLLGGDQRANAILHVGRLSVERERPVLWVNVNIVLEFGGRRRKRHIEPPCDRAYSALAAEMDARDIAHPIDTDWGRMTWMEARRVFDFAATIERDEPERLLCDDAECRWCKGIRYFLAKERE